MGWIDYFFYKWMESETERARNVVTVILAIILVVVILVSIYLLFFWR